MWGETLRKLLTGYCVYYKVNVLLFKDKVKVSFKAEIVILGVGDTAPYSLVMCNSAHPITHR